MGKSTKEVEKKASRGRKVMITDSKSGKEEARVDVIKKLWNDGEGKTRSEIRDILKEKYNHEVKYQIVFAATKPAKKDADAEAA